MFSIEKKSGRFAEKSGKTKLKNFGENWKRFFVWTQDYNSGFERWLCVILFWFCLLGFWISFRKKIRDNYKGKSENSDKFQKL
jgi:hypothetical protein